jgi:hypothetical protein
MKITEFKMQLKIQIERLKKGRKMEMPRCREQLRLLNEKIAKRNASKSNERSATTVILDSSGATSNDEQLALKY